jgi:serine protease Do
LKSGLKKQEINEQFKKDKKFRLKKSSARFPFFVSPHQSRYIFSLRCLNNFVILNAPKFFLRGKLMMLKPAEDSSSKIEQKILRKVFVLLSVFTVFAVTVGIGIGLLISERRASAGETPNTAAVEAVSNSFSEVATRVEPAVVNIDTKGAVPEPAAKSDKPTTGTPDEILDYFKRQLPRRPSSAVGSGFIVDKAGFILTNYHVIEDSARITVRLQNGEEYIATTVGKDEETDLAVLKINAGKELPTIRFGNSDSVQVGDWVLAIGSPFGLAQTVTAGIISQTKRETPQASPFQKFIQTDAAINRGNSGGPLVNMRGEVIGVNSQIATTTGDYNGIGFALPSNEARNVYNQIIQGGKVRRGFLGVELDSVKQELAKIYNLPDAKGAIVTQLRDRQSAAVKAGLEVNDIIIEFNGQPVENAQDLIAKISSTEPEREVTIIYLREANDRLERKMTTAKLSERRSLGRSQSDDEKPKKLSPNDKKSQVLPLGLTLVELTPQLATANRLEGQKGLLVKEIDPSSFISDLKTSTNADMIRENDLIQRVNRINVTDLKTFNEIVGKLKTGDPVVLHIANYNRFSQRVQQRIVQFTVK